MFLKKKIMTYIIDYLNKLRKLIDDTDNVVIGAGAGLSTAAGFIYDGERFNKYFFDFINKYHFKDMYSGGFMIMQATPNIYWAYWSRYIYINRYMNPKYNVYDNLLNLIKDKDYFVITTNVDHCFQKANFDKKRLFYTQGDYGLFQCSKACHNKTYDNKDIIEKMLIAQGFLFDDKENLIIPKDNNIKMEIANSLIPYCPICNEMMTMNLRSDDKFVEDDTWHEAAKRYSNYINDKKNKKVIYLELGVGYNKPAIIKYPFYQYTYDNPLAYYICINNDDNNIPEEIKDRSLMIKGDIKEILELLIDK